MKKYGKTVWGRALLWGALLTLSVSAAIRLLVGNLYRLVSFSPELEQAFAQLKEARVRPPLLLLLALSFLFCFWASARVSRGRGRGLPVWLGLLLWPVLFVGGLLLSFVNRVLFADMIPVFVQLGSLLSFVFCR
ncbi:MAG: hypothetical protein IKD06_07100 [Clostridia bacterium]|nr:hypothetical protein [Clostridia bacterium]